MHVVHVPSPQDEASRQLMRDRGELQKEVLQHRDRMRKLLATLGCWENIDSKAFPAVPAGIAVTQSSFANVTSSIRPVTGTRTLNRSATGLSQAVLC
jgi:hypothetical protein